jgi:uncharacterized phosphosugar-binding protein
LMKNSSSPQPVLLLTYCFSVAVVAVILTVSACDTRSGIGIDRTPAALDRAPTASPTSDNFVNPISASQDKSANKASPPIDYPANSGARAYQTWMMACLDAHQIDLPKLTISAERAAELFVMKNATLTLAGDEGFVSEAFGRAGGLMTIGRWGGETGATMVILYALRHAKLAEDVARIKMATAAGSMVVLFAPESDLATARGAGLNGLAEVRTHAAPHGGLFEGKDGVWAVPTETVALMIAEWVWIGEFIAACTRHGQMPAVWKSFGAEGGEAWAVKYRGKRYHDHFPSVVAPGVAGTQFIRELRLVLKALYNEERANLLALADWTVRALKNGKSAYIFVVGHCIRHHIGVERDPRYFRLFSKDWFYEDPAVVINPGDVILCIGQGGLPVEWGGFSKQDLPGKWRSQGAKIAWSFGNLRDSEFARQKAMIPQAELFIDQRFTLGDGLVEIPNFEIGVLPASGITSEAVFWLATAEVHSRITRDPAEREQPPKAAVAAPSLGSGTNGLPDPKLAKVPPQKGISYQLL